MNDNDTVFILGAGAIGLALAVKLSKYGRSVQLVHTHSEVEAGSPVSVVLNDGKTGEREQVILPVCSLATIETLNGVIAITAKSYANVQIAAQLKEKACQSPIILMQNGIGVETPFLKAGFAAIYRCILYSASHRTGRYAVQFCMFKSSQVGVVRGTQTALERLIAQLSTPDFVFHSEPHIQQAIWKKGIINAVYNTICPLLEVDNGIFMRDPATAKIASEVIAECVQVAAAIGIPLDKQMILDEVLNISRVTDGQLASTLQDLHHKRQTEIDSLNLEIVRVAERVTPRVDVPRTKLLGQLITAKWTLSHSSQG